MIVERQGLDIVKDLTGHFSHAIEGKQGTKLGMWLAAVGVRVQRALEDTL